MSYNPAKHNPWQLQNLSQTKILIICPFFYLSKPKQINNSQCIHFIQQGNLRVHFGMTDVKKKIVYFPVVPVHISETTLTLMVSLQHPWII